MERERAARATGVILSLSALVATFATPAAANPSPDQRVRALLSRVHVLQRQAAEAERRYGRSLSDVGRAVTVSNLAQRDVGTATAAANAARDQLSERITAIYASGGPTSLFVSTLDAGSINDFENRTVMVQHVLDADHEEVVAEARALAAAQERAAAAVRRANRQIATARSVATAADRVDRLLASQAALLAEARKAAAQAAAVAAAQRALAQQEAQLASVTSSGIASLHVLPPSAAYLALYHHAAATCAGLSWTVLAAIGQVESGHGRNPSMSSAGALGPMQFLPSTFATYGVDGDHDGKLDIMDPADAIYTAAHYLCANGAGGGSAALANAIWHYNHADWYVQMVLTLARQYAAG